MEFLERQPTLGDMRKAVEDLSGLPDETPVCAARYRPLGMYRLANEPFVTVALPCHTLRQWPMVPMQVVPMQEVADAA